MAIVNFSCKTPKTLAISGSFGKLVRTSHKGSSHVKRQTKPSCHRAIFLICSFVVTLPTLVGCGAGSTDQAAVSSLEEAGLIVLQQNKEAYGLLTARKAISAETAADIAKLGDLKNLDFTASEMSDEIFTTAVQNFKPVSVVLNDTKVTGAGLAAISKARVEAIFLRNTPITDDDLKVLGELSTLAELNLDGTQITGAGLAHLSGLTKLKRLILSNTKVDDAGLLNLKPLTSLSKIDAKGSSITPEGGKALSDSIPGLLIDL